jgi:protein-ribulosamine 3-kinase
MNTSIEKYLNQFFSDKFSIQVSLQFKSIGGGSINDSYQVRLNNSTRFFLKINSKDEYPKLFEEEKRGLGVLAEQNIIRTPSIIACNEIGDYQVLLMEWIENGVRTEQFWKKFGEQLAALHHVSNSYFGFEEDNYMGVLPQVNEPQKSWIDFFSHYRLQPQIEIAKEKQLLQAKHLLAFENLNKQLNSIFNEEKPSLLHGDLWSGNYMSNQFSQPVLIDPAIYFGHRSMDLAMTTLFGGFDKLFYESYNYYFPLPQNHREQWQICNLYPLLIHLNLFGSSYLDQIERTLKTFQSFD